MEGRGVALGWRGPARRATRIKWCADAPTSFEKSRLPQKMEASACVYMRTYTRRMCYVRTRAHVLYFR